MTVDISHCADTISLTINIGNATYPANTSAADPGAEQGAGLAADDPGWDHMSSALWGIVLGAISFLTIVGNIMVSGSADKSACRNIYKIFLLNFRKTRILRRFM